MWLDHLFVQYLGAVLLNVWHRIRCLRMYLLAFSSTYATFFGWCIRSMNARNRLEISFSARLSQIRILVYILHILFFSAVSLLYMWRFCLFDIRWWLCHFVGNNHALWISLIAWCLRLRVVRVRRRSKYFSWLRIKNRFFCVCNE